MSGLPACAVARRRRRSPAGCSSLAGCPGMSICCWAAALSAAGAAAVSSPVRVLDVARRFGLLPASAPADSAALGAGAEDPPACASLMTSISWLLRIRAVPLMPRPDATCCSSARTMPSRPVPERRRRAVVPVAAPSAGTELSTFLSAVTPIRSVVSLTKGPSLERTSAFWLGDRLCCPTAVCRSCRSRTLPGRWSAGYGGETNVRGSGARSPCSAHSWTSKRVSCRFRSVLDSSGRLLRQSGRLTEEWWSRSGTRSNAPRRRRLLT